MEESRKEGDNPMHEGSCQRGLASLCIGGGQGFSMVLESV